MIKKQLFIAILPLALAACDPKVDTGGYVRETDFKEQIIVGQTTREETQARFGSPSSQSSFGEESWYYITDRKETTAFFKPKVVEQNVTRIVFDASGVASKVETFDMKDAKDLKLVKRQTPTEGHSLGFAEQILGNIGRFNKGADDAVAPGRRPGR